MVKVVDFGSFLIVLTGKKKKSKFFKYTFIHNEDYFGVSICNECTTTLDRRGSCGSRARVAGCFAYFCLDKLFFFESIFLLCNKIILFLP